MTIKYTPHFLHRLEDVFAESDYVLRYEKGQFKSGYCLLHDKKIAVINKYYSLEGKINCLVDIIRQVEMNTSRMNEKNKTLYAEIRQPQLNLGE